MAYYDGVANSYEDLRTALFTACLANGWAQDGNFLTKGAAALEVTTRVTNAVSAGPGVVLRGGSHVDAGVLMDPSSAMPRLGPPHLSISPATWPMVYEVYVFTDPDEVFMIARFGVVNYFWLAFGLSDIPGLPGTGLWLGATSNGGASDRASGGIRISPTGGGGSLGFTSGFLSSPGLMWESFQSNHGPAQCGAINCGLDGRTWALPPSVVNLNQVLPAAATFNAVQASAPRIENGLGGWSNGTPLLPINCYLGRPSNRISLVASVRNARYLRIDYYEPEQVLTLGDDQWKIYPFYRKNISARDGGDGANEGIDHTGTFGWALRYEGP